MFDMLQSIFWKNGVKVPAPTFWELVIAIVVSMLLGLVIAFTYMKCSRSTKGFLITLAVLPAATGTIICLVNGNLGMSIAVLGTFSLVRFRSAQGTALEISGILIATSTGIACGVGFVYLAPVCTVLMCGMVFLLTALGFGKRGSSRDLRILVPESLNYGGVFDDLFAQYTTKAELVRTKTTAMGSMYDLTYSVTLKAGVDEKAFLDDIRVRNGNLTVSLTAHMKNGEEF
ncbi:MAG: DUF4956 domain-containing protein [Clostridia bacterium]|nr:DUF4956 domain-containing protein [Clostridia bacterium]